LQGIPFAPFEKELSGENSPGHQRRLRVRIPATSRRTCEFSFFWRKIILRRNFHKPVDYITWELRFQAFFHIFSYIFVKAQVESVETTLLHKECSAHAAGRSYVSVRLLQS
jgi:hypothetical protein